MTVLDIFEQIFRFIDRVTFSLKLLFNVNGIRWPLFYYLHHNLQKLLTIKHSSFCQFSRLQDYRLVAKCQPLFGNMHIFFFLPHFLEEAHVKKMQKSIFWLINKMGSIPSLVKLYNNRPSVITRFSLAFVE